MTADLSPMRPTRDPRVTLDDLLEVVLNKGAVLHLDLIVAVADIPLIGVSLRAAIAGMETMLEYGMMRHWDEDTRAWAERSTARRALDLEEDENVVCRMSGGHLLTEGLYHGWRPGTVYLTDRRLVVLRDEPREILWETGLDAVTAVRLEPERTVGGEERLRLDVALADGGQERLSAREPGELHALLTEACAGRPAPALPFAFRSPAEEHPPLAEGHLWYHEPRRGGPLWRGGQGRMTADRLVWKSPVDSRPALVLPLADITAVRRVPAYSPAGEDGLIAVHTTAGDEVRLAADDPAAWTERLRAAGASTGPVAAAG
ncbi:gas vesicle protein GvpJ [Streptomyces sp. H-KF8]|uniref:gas vesicle protein GvpJ n=1 Tax=Streptomyces sp. H-KF8 TaxID=1727216 RepID=UPI000A94F34B|nr:gas vesicle protein GvpJ [Streptomyces sp. H-KF8]